MKKTLLYSVILLAILIFIGITIYLNKDIFTNTNNIGDNKPIYSFSGTTTDDTGFKMENGYLTGIEPERTVSDFDLGLDSNYTTTIVDRNGVVKTSGYIFTGDKIIVKSIDDSTKEYKVIILGDSNGDGKISPLDYVKIKNHITETNIINEEVYLKASDINEDDNISPLDYVKLKKYILNRSTTKYTITYNANGGFGSVNSQEVTKDTTTNVRRNTFTKDGYTFSGWNTIQDGSGISYSEVSKIKVTWDVTLYAQWKENQIVNEKLKIYYLSLGRFDGFLIQGNGTTIFIDGGYVVQGKKCVEFLKRLGVTKIDALIGSHLHDNHIDAHKVLIDNFEIGHVYYGVDPRTCKENKVCGSSVNPGELNKKLANLPVTILTPGFDVKIGNLTFDILAPITLENAANRNSLHMILKYGNKKFYFTGDSEAKVFDAVYNTYDHDVFSNISIFKHPHHGQNEVPIYFIDVMSPEYVVVPNGGTSLGAKTSAKEYKKIGSTVYFLGHSLADSNDIGSSPELKGYLLAETDGVTLEIIDKRK